MEYGYEDGQTSSELQKYLWVIISLTKVILEKPQCD
jgi:hypothetical protein